MTTPILSVSPVRHTGPLSSDLFSADVTIAETEECVHIEAQGIIVQRQPPDFLLGVYWGRLNYLEVVEDLVNADGSRSIGPVTTEDLDTGRVRMEKVLDVTAREVTSFIFDTVQNNVSHESEEWRAGYLVGFFNACSDAYLGQSCKQCGNRLGTCTHEKSSTR